MMSNSNFFKYTTLLLLISTILFFMLYLKKKREYELITRMGITYIAESNKGCDQYKWKSNDSVSSILCTSDGIIYDYWSYYNYFGKQIIEGWDRDQNGMADKEIVYNKNGAKIAEYWDMSGDGFYDKMIIYRDRNKTEYKDLNEDGFFDENEIVSLN